jgi:hypothetical protein
MLDERSKTCDEGRSHPVTGGKAAFEGAALGLDALVGACRLPPHLHSFQLPFQPLQRGGSFVCPNHRLAVLAVGDAHQYCDVLKPLLHKREIMTELNCLLAGKRAHIF